MQGPLKIDPAKLEEAKKAYNADMAANHKDLVDGDGKNHAISPFVTDSEGNTTFNRWIDGENRYSAQNKFFDDKEVGADGKTTTVRRPSWQSFSEYTNDEARGQFDYISKALEMLQGKGFDEMSSLYKKAIKKVS